MTSKLKRSLNLTQLAFYGVGSMVGAGIYSIIGPAAGDAGVHLWVSFILAGIAAVLTVLSYAELTSMIQEAGAEYQFMKAAFPRFKFPSFMAGYLIALNAAATSATVALAFAGYLSVFVDAPDFLTAFGLLVICTLINIAGIRQSVWVGIVLICIEVGGLLLLIGAGFTAGEIGRSFSEMPAWGDLGGIIGTTALLFFVFVGFEDVANLSEETIKPKQTIPKALLLSAVITSVMYVLVAIAAVSLATPEKLASSDSPLTLAVGSVAPWMGVALGIAALFATSSTALISLVSISRMLYGMARGGSMPKILSKTFKVRQTPWVAALALFAAASLLLTLGKVKTVASVSATGVLLVFTGVHVALIVLRFRKPAARRNFTVPLSIGRVPVLPIIGIILSLFLLVQFEWVVYAVAGGAVLFGALVYQGQKMLAKK